VEQGAVHLIDQLRRARRPRRRFMPCAESLNERGRRRVIFSTRSCWQIRPGFRPAMPSLTARRSPRAQNWASPILPEIADFPAVELQAEKARLRYSAGRARSDCRSQVRLAIGVGLEGHCVPGGVANSKSIRQKRRRTCDR
jgi:hypothetical protein